MKTLALALVLAGCGGRVADPVAVESTAAPAPAVVEAPAVADPPADPGPVPKDRGAVVCANVSAYAAAIARNACELPALLAGVDLADREACVGAAADLDACYAVTDCRLPLEIGLLETCEGLVPQWKVWP